MSNSNPYVQQGEAVTQRPNSSKNAWLIGCLIAACISIPIVLVCGGVLVGLTLPAVQAAREAARRMSCSNNMKEIALALHNYHSAYNMLPPAYTVDAEGRPLHSWRTIILPFIGQQALYQQIDFSKPWDDPANEAARMSAILTYRCPSVETDPLLTTYVAIVDPSAVFTGSSQTTFRMITDGLAQTVLLTETETANAVHWMSPQDINLQTYLQAGSNRTSGHQRGAHSVLADGAVKFIADSLNPAVREAMVTIAGGEEIPLDAAD